MSDSPSYTIAADGLSIKCHVCGRTSYNPGDIRELFCEGCAEFHGERMERKREQIREMLRSILWKETLV